ncbi:hypothetical protein [Pararhizobium sp. IMCC21322]|uniref:hypothetical protein n=1 Tax=Pararhizobium sp. IMCC21322 TaxID=3067903 RepID=UPI002740AEA3|nr:hypothetical protein [Pararhizobium sp. IMCC21322]
MSQTRALLIDAVERLKDDNFETGPNWSSCHDLCQSREGSPDYDWVHGLVHLIEGDKSNASYWYRRAGKTQASHELEREWQSILNELRQE